ncbi:MAG: hypothetical protein ABFC31_10915 [Clostridiaceae bacterium]
MYWFTKDDDYARTCLDAISADADVATNLKQIRDALSIDVEEGKIDFDNLSSIPDIWSTQRIFDMMLYLPPNVRAEDPVLEQYRAAVVRQWQAILTVMLIGESVYNLQFVINSYSTAAIKQNAADGTLAGRFLAAVISSRPQNFIWADENDVPFNQDVVRVYSIRSGRTLLPIAISSPTTYFAPAPDAWKHLFLKVPWIKRTIDSKGKVRYAVSNKLMEELNYREATALEAALRCSLRVPVKTVDFARARIYDNMVSSFSGDPKLLTACDPFRQEALLIPELSYFSGTIATLTPDDADPLLGGVDSSCYHIDSMQYLDNTQPYYYYSQFFMPITGLCRKLLAEGELEYSIQVSAKQGLVSDATVTLTRRRDGEKIQMLYGKANPIRRIERLSDISSVTLWPRQKIEGWTSYFAFRYDQEPETSQQSSASVYPRYTIEPDVQARSNYLVPSATGRKFNYYSMNTFPEYWVAEKTIGSESVHVGYLKTRVSRTIHAPESGNTYYAAVDFGTTSTMLYGCVNKDVPKPVSAKALYAGAVCNPDRGENDQSISCFVPPETESWDIGLLHSLLAVPTQTTGGIPSALYGIWAYFRSAATEKRAWPKMDRLEIHSNLKWNVISPYNTHNYLTEVMYLLALEARMNACGTLQVYASYPGAMSKSRMKTYIAAVAQILGTVAQITGLHAAPVNQITESFAVATQVAGDGIGMNFCSIDIGGGTSDIFLYYKRELKKPWRGVGSSLKIGARTIFHSEFWLNPDLLSRILRQQLGQQSIRLLLEQFRTPKPKGTGSLGIAELKDAQLNEEQIHSVIEGLLEFSILKDGKFYKVADMLKNIVLTSNDAGILDFRLRIAYYLGAVCYYAGMLARERQGLEPLLISNLTIQFAGNGSKIIDWISDNDDAISDFAKEMFRSGMNQAEQPRAVQFSGIPKHEVARGTLLSIGSALQVKEQNIILAGERFVQGDKVYSALSSMEDAAASDEIYPEQDELRAFLNAFYRSVGRVVPYNSECRQFAFPEEDEPGFKNKVMGTIQTLRTGNEELKPFFLVGAELIDSLSRKKEGIAR